METRVCSRKGCSSQAKSTRGLCAKHNEKFWCKEAGCTTVAKFRNSSCALHREKRAAAIAGGVKIERKKAETADVRRTSQETCSGGSSSSSSSAMPSASAAPAAKLPSYKNGGLIAGFKRCSVFMCLKVVLANGRCRLHVDSTDPGVDVRTSQSIKLGPRPQPSPARLQATRRQSAPEARASVKREEPVAKQQEKKRRRSEVVLVCRHPGCEKTLPLFCTSGMCPTHEKEGLGLCQYPRCHIAAREGAYCASHTARIVKMEKGLAEVKSPSSSLSPTRVTRAMTKGQAGSATTAAVNAENADALEHQDSSSCCATNCDRLAKDGRCEVHQNHMVCQVSGCERLSTKIKSSKCYIHEKRFWGLCEHYRCGQVAVKEGMCWRHHVAVPTASASTSSSSSSCSDLSAASSAVESAPESAPAPAAGSSKGSASPAETAARTAPKGQGSNSLSRAIAEATSLCRTAGCKEPVFFDELCWLHMHGASQPADQDDNDGDDEEEEEEDKEEEEEKEEEKSRTLPHASASTNASAKSRQLGKGKQPRSSTSKLQRPLKKLKTEPVNSKNAVASKIRKTRHEPRAEDDADDASTDEEEIIDLCAEADRAIGHKASTDQALSFRFGVIYLTLRKFFGMYGLPLDEPFGSPSEGAHTAEQARPTKSQAEPGQADVRALSSEAKQLQELHGTSAHGPSEPTSTRTLGSPREPIPRGLIQASSPRAGPSEALPTTETAAQSPNPGAALEASLVQAAPQSTETSSDQMSELPAVPPILRDSSSTQRTEPPSALKDGCASEPIIKPSSTSVPLAQKPGPLRWKDVFQKYQVSLDSPVVAFELAEETQAQEMGSHYISLTEFARLLDVDLENVDGAESSSLLLRKCICLRVRTGDRVLGTETVSARGYMSLSGLFALHKVDLEASCAGMTMHELLQAHAVALDARCVELDEDLREDDEGGDVPSSAMQKRSGTARLHVRTKPRSGLTPTRRATFGDFCKRYGVSPALVDKLRERGVPMSLRCVSLVIRLPGLAGQ